MENKIIEVIVLLIISGIGYYTMWLRTQEMNRKKPSIDLSKEIFKRIKAQFKKD